MTLRLDITATDGAARTGTITTPRGTFQTPCFMPVATRASIRAFTTADLEALGAEVMLSNTYHLMLRPGADVVAALGGIHGFAAWNGHVLTDSGGYQVFSLKPKVDDDGATFRSTYDGSIHHLTPERAVEVQELLGADIQMVLDVCPPLPSPPQVIRQAVERTAAWAARAKAAHRREGQALFGIVQGGVDPELRREAAERTAALDFPGFGIGGLSVGESRDEMLPALEAAIGGLPPERPRYLMGLGDPVGLVESIARGVDMFDCVLPTRLARHGSVLTSGGRLQIRNAAHARDDSPLDSTCPCAVCARYSRAYLRHLLQVGEPAALQLLTGHNLAWILALVKRARASIASGTLDELRRVISTAYD
ncbi:MAG TPA: tRNA guanosine(34) transglycosylase Tgt [Acidimicrobiales bacterium]|jgi:queuine tRNA-ribosyltransferase|nr:tRNA guanosine(34) transglycosylase Tgt [Acidimicrobiales bacterium]